MNDDFQGMSADAKYGEVTSDERMWAMLAHLSILVFSIFGPLIIWMIKKEESAFIEDLAVVRTHQDGMKCISLKPCFFKTKVQ